MPGGKEGEDGYVLGRSEHEARHQAARGKFFALPLKHFLEDAGLVAGMRVPDVRKLVAIDMALHGPRFTVAEFAVGVLGCAALCLLSLRAGLPSQTARLSWPFLIGVELISSR
jgi:hypothetical protein